MKLICKQCGIIYEGCPTCQNSRNYAWRNEYCSIKCFQSNLKGELEIMRVQYESKMYSVKEYDLKGATYTLTTLDGDLEVKEEEIQAFILPLEEYKKLKYGRYTKKKVEITESEEK